MDTAVIGSQEAWFEDAAKDLASLPAEMREQRLEALRKMAILQSSPENLEAPPPIRNMGEYLEHKIETPPMLVEPGQLARGATTALIARAGKGKTTMTLNRIIRWSIGRPMFDGLPTVMAPTQALRILIIENEGAPGFFQEKLQLMFESHPMSEEEREMAKANILIWGEGGYPRIKLDDPETEALVRRGVETFEPDVILMEPFRSLWRGEENSATEMQKITDILADIAAEYQVGILLTHHENKGGGDAGSTEQMTAARGSTVLEGEAAVMERYRQIKENVSELSWIKPRFGRPAAPVRMEFQWETWTYEYVPEEAGKREILDLLAANPEVAMTVREISDDLEETDRRVRRLLREMVDDPEETRLREYKSVHSGAGSTGKRYRIVLDEEQADETGGLEY